MSMSGRRQMCQVRIQCLCWEKGESSAKLYSLQTLLTVFPRGLPGIRELRWFGAPTPPFPISCLFMNVLTSFCFMVDPYFWQTRNEPTRTISLKIPRPVVTFPACLPLDANCRLCNVRAVSVVAVARFLSRFTIKFVLLQRCCWLNKRVANVAFGKNISGVVPLCLSSNRRDKKCSPIFL